MTPIDPTVLIFSKAVKLARGVGGGDSGVHWYYFYRVSLSVPSTAYRTLHGILTAVGLPSTTLVSGYLVTCVLHTIGCPTEPYISTQ
jgi:hypothetical protein